MGKLAELPKIVETHFIGPPDEIITGARLTAGQVHARIQVWNRGGHAGELTVKAEDARAIISRLLPDATIVPIV